MSSIEYLEEERKKLWEFVLQLEKNIKNKLSDDEKEAKQSSKKTSEYKNRSQEAKDAVLRLLEQSQNENSEIKQLLQSAQEQHHAISTINTEANWYHEKITAIEEKIGILEDIYENRDSISEKIEALEDLHKNGAETASKINATFNNLQKRKSEIDDLYFEIMGYEDEDESTGEKISEKGLKYELEQSFAQTKNELELLKKEIIRFREDETKKYSNEIDKNKSFLNENIKIWEDEYKKTTSKIRSLLPDALTAGLSHAFYEKRTAEIEDGKKLNKSFTKAIFGLVCVSTIPFLINIYMLNQGKTIDSIIFDTPRVVIAILPLYIPFLWLAYSTNKRINLSKRLVEEYTHKEVLSKTFEGLSNQIENIEDNDISDELRIKLLYNILDVSSENPGKLISDYNKADHPVMDVLEKSLKLSNAVDSLKKIPGMKRVARIFDERTISMLDTQAKKIESAIDVAIDKHSSSPAELK